ncbi:pyrroline-5-carboxylate reductase [Streptohalobacillus salinus]|uniref:Pyrroline-5-carboxylate reductase n=1 Tax=Streptohalobacillus salinus TaxID=621096 RepID=A0A2V3W718_9BACI|nr:pyrroline-5-carboxylate reductase [Streptohalobacillus salinus]PXW89830.1 pyrroline-5-carboxylate reductase [Streptohalobacillus salinus]
MKIAFIGAGQMAEAIISGLVEKEEVQAQAIYATNKHDPEQLQRLTDTYGIKTSEDVKEAVSESDVVIIAVKPKDKDAALSEIKALLPQSTLVISVMAGVPTATIEAQLNAGVKVIRTMPNTSAKIGLGATALARGRFADDASIDTAAFIFNAVGITEEIAEKDMHAITAVSGSGPAYFYYMVEAMMEEAVALGLSETVSEAFIYQTILGASHMLQEIDLPPAVLRENITSPNGTTEAGLKALDQLKVKQAIRQAVKAAHDRSITLGKGE